MIIDFQKYEEEKERVERLTGLFEGMFGEKLSLDQLLQAVESKIYRMQFDVLEEALSHFKSNEPEDAERILILKKVIKDAMGRAEKPVFIPQLAEVTALPKKDFKGSRSQELDGRGREPSNGNPSTK